MNTWIITVALVILSSVPVLAQDVPLLLKKAAAAEAGFREEEALSLYQQVLRQQPRAVAVLCRCSDLCCRIGNLILGRWNYEISKLNFVERAFARWFYGDLPPASLADAIRNYEKGLALRPDFMLNYYELAKALHRDGRDAQAIAMLRKMDGLHDEMYDDRTVRVEGRKFIAEWSK